MNSRRILLICLLACLACADLASDRQIIFTLTNQARAVAGVDPLILDDSLNAAAQGHSEYMAQTGDFSHNTQSTGSPTDRAGEQVGENIAAGYDLLSMFQAWMGSDGHKANILNSTYGRIGIGIALNQNGLIYATQKFGYPN